LSMLAATCCCEVLLPSRVIQKEPCRDA
jgi:hypothetical protein